MTRPQDADVIAEWAASLTAGGWTRTSAARAGKRVRAFARFTAGGILNATRDELVRFFAARAGTAGQAFDAFHRGEGWRKSVRAIRQFWTWAARRGLVSADRTPLDGIRHLPSQRRPPLTLASGRAFDRVLHAPSPPRDAAILWLLAFGITAAEIVRLTPDAVDLERREVHVLGRIIPVTARAAAALSPWTSRKHLGDHHWLFPSAKPSRPAAPGVVGNVVRRAAWRTFPRPQQDHLRARVSVAGFRQLYLVRALRRHVGADCIADLLGIESLPTLRRYAGQVTRERLHRELGRITRRWKRWVR